MRKIILLTLSLTISITLAAQDKINFLSLRETNLEKVKEIANQENKPVLLYFTSNACGPCIKMERNVFIDKNIIKLFNNSFVCAKSKTEFVGNQMKSKDFKKLNKEPLFYSKKFNVTGNPTFIVINSDGDIIHKTEGYKNIQQLLDFGNDALSDDKSYFALRKKIQAGDYSFETVKRYLQCIEPASRYMDKGFKCEAQDVLDNYFNTQKEINYISENNWYLINNHVDNPKSKPFDYFLKNQNAFISIYGEQEVNKRIFHILRIYSYTGNINSNRYKKASKEIETLKYPQAIALVKYYSVRNENDLNKYATKIDNVFSEYFYVFDSDINNKVWAIYKASENKELNIDIKTLEIASKWMDLIVKHNPKNKYYKDTNLKIKEKIHQLKV